jgi:hypothetical protein
MKLQNNLASFEPSWLVCGSGFVSAMIWTIAAGKPLPQAKYIAELR